jgi:hypothetical protein
MKVGEIPLEIGCATPPVVLQCHRFSRTPSSTICGMDLYHAATVEDSVFGAGPVSLSHEVITLPMRGLRVKTKLLLIVVFSPAMVVDHMVMIKWRQTRRSNSCQLTKLQTDRSVLWRLLKIRVHWSMMGDAFLIRWRDLRLSHSFRPHPATPGSWSGSGGISSLLGDSLLQIVSLLENLRGLHMPSLLASLGIGGVGEGGRSVVRDPQDGAKRKRWNSEAWW